MNEKIALNALSIAIAVLGLASGVVAAETRVDLTSINNIYGIGTPGTAVTSGGYDTGGGAYAGDLLGASLTYNGATFNLSAPGPSSAVSNTIVALPAGQFATLSWLGAAVNGPQTNQTFIVTYTDATTSTFTQSVDDYGRVPQNFAGETVVTTNPLPLPYKIDAGGAKHSGTYRVFGFSFPLNSAKTVKSLTLPANRDVGVLAIDLIPAASGATSVNLSAASTIFGVSRPGLTFTGGGLDQNGGSYAGDLLGTSLVVAGNIYTIPTPGPNTAVSSTTVPLPAGTFGQLTLLGTAVDGAQTNQAFVVAYTDATTTTFTQSFSDWGSTPQNYPNETVAKTVAYKILANGTTHANTYKLYAYTLALNAAKTVKSVALPNNRKVVFIAADLIPAAAARSTAISLAGASTLFGISKPGLAVTGGGIDQGGSAYAGDQLGTALTLSGSTYQFAAPGPNSAATSTTITLPVGQYTRLTVLGTAVEGTQKNQAFVVSYTDSTTTTFTQSLSDWGSAPQNYPNETIAKTLSYKILANGTTHANTYKLYAYAFALNSAKVVKSLQLPSNRKVVILAANLVGTVLPVAASPEFSPLPGTFTSGPTVSLSDVTPGASIYFTTDGTAPSTSSTKYTVPFKMAATSTVQAIAAANGYSVSPLVTAAYTINAAAPATATPTFSPVGGSYSTAQTVSLSDSTSGASLYFTTDGSTPTQASTKYTSGIAVTSSKVSKAIGVVSGHTSSAIAAATYTIGGTVVNPPSGLSYGTPPALLVGKLVTLSPTVAGTVMQYIVNPSLPTGLVINASSGVISGTPTTVTSSALYVITASNSKGSDAYTLPLQVDSGPRVHLSATATTASGAALTYTWKVTDGALTGTNGAQADWELPPGFGLHFAYVLVADGRGGFAEGRVIVNTDSIGAPQVIPVKTLPPSLNPASHRGSGVEPRRLEHAAASAARRSVRPDGISQSMTYFGLVRLADHHLPGINDPFFNLLVPTRITLTPTYCPGDSSCPVTEDFGAPTAIFGENLFGDYSVTSNQPGIQDLDQTVAAKIQNSSTASSTFTVDVKTTDIGVVRVEDLVIPGTGSPTISAISATFNNSSVGTFELILPSAAGQPSDSYPQQNWFLSYKGGDTAISACQYYLAVGAVTGCDANGKASGGMKFTDWQAQVGIDHFATDGIKTTTATYVNVVDLNLTRAHHSIRHDGGNVAAYVCNHSGPVDATGKPLSVNLPSNTMTSAQQVAVNTAVSNANNGKNLVACVAMDYLSTPINDFAQFTRFLVFGPSGELLPSVNLDGRGEKYVPGACVACHGGDNYSGKFGNVGTGPDIGAHFLPYDTGNFAFSTAAGLTQSAQEAAIYQLNQNILTTNPTSSTSNLISNWYQAGQILDQNYVPTAWSGFPDVYQEVIARSCRTCHSALPNYDWDSLGPDSFASFYNQVCDRGDNYGTQAMPNSKVTFDRLWNSAGTAGDQPAKLAAFYHAQGTLPTGLDCVLRAPPH